MQRHAQYLETLGLSTVFMSNFDQFYLGSRDLKFKRSFWSECSTNPSSLTVLGIPYWHAE